VAQQLTTGTADHLQRPLPEEIEVMQAVLDGFKDQAIARRLGISIITVRRRVSRFVRRVGAQNRTQAIAIGVVQGWLRLDVPQSRSPDGRSQ